MKILISSSLFYYNNQSFKYNNLYKNIINSLYIIQPYTADIVIFYDETVPNKIVNDLKNIKNVILHKKSKSNNRSGCFWRYESLDLYKNYDLYIFRDIDISLDDNDKFIIENMMYNKEKIFYIFMVHKRKPYPKQGFLMGGMFGIKKEAIPSFNELIREYNNNLEYYGSDEEFLALSLYNKCRPIVFIEPRLIDKVELDNSFYVKHNLPENYERYIYLPKNYEKYN